MTVSIIAAMAKNRVIGCENKLPWNLPADLQHFKNLTLGHHILMGRKTYESIGKALPGRKSVVITHQPGYKAAGCLVAHSLKEALMVSEDDDEVFIIGGAQIYEQALPLARYIYLTIIHEDFEGDAYFPKFAEDSWNIVSREDHQPDEENPYPFSFIVYEKKAKN